MTAGSEVVSANREQLGEPGLPLLPGSKEVVPPSPATEVECLKRLAKTYDIIISRIS